MWAGYMVYDGVEIINVARTLAYSQHAVPALGLKDTWGADSLGEALGEDYESPLVDRADWFDEGDPDTWNFFGVYPLDVRGGADSTRVAVPVELAGDGSVTMMPRHSGREVYVRALLVAGDPAGLEAGMSWLRSALTGSLCGSDGCGAGTLCYFNSRPVVNTTAPGFTSVEDCTDPYHRTLYGVTTLSGPTTLREYSTDSAAMREVTFTIIAGVPFAYGLPRTVVDSLDGFTPSVEAAVACEAEGPGVLHDPDCEQPPAPPSAPPIENPCLEEPETWSRYHVPIPSQFVPLWNDAVPHVTVTTGSSAARQVRIRFYPNPFNWDPEDLEECDFCGEFVISYIPAGSAMEIDGVQQTATVSVAGGPSLVATHLLYGSDGGPMDWPLLTCGTGYLMTVDVAPTADDVDVALTLAGRE